MAKALKEGLRDLDAFFIIPVSCEGEAVQPSARGAFPSLSCAMLSGAQDTMETRLVITRRPRRLAAGAVIDLSKRKRKPSDPLPAERPAKHRRGGLAGAGAVCAAPAEEPLSRPAQPRPPGTLWRDRAGPTAPHRTAALPRRAAGGRSLPAGGTHPSRARRRIGLASPRCPPGPAHSGRLRGERAEPRESPDSARRGRGRGHVAAGAGPGAGTRAGAGRCRGGCGGCGACGTCGTRESRPVPVAAALGPLLSLAALRVRRGLRPGAGPGRGGACGGGRGQRSLAGCGGAPPESGASSGPGVAQRRGKLGRT